MMISYWKSAPGCTGAAARDCRQSAGVGKIFIKFETPETATKALRALAGRKFADRTVVTTYFPEVGSVCETINGDR